MQYVLALHVFAKNKREQNLLPQHRHIYMYRNILILQMQNDPTEYSTHLLIVTGFLPCKANTIC